MQTKYKATRNRVISRIAIAAFASASAILGGHASARPDVTVFSDNFNRSDTTTLDNNWVEVNAVGSQSSTDGDAALSSNTLFMTNDSTAATNFRGRTYAVQPLSNFLSPFNATLSSNPGLVTWSANMCISGLPSSEPSGFNYVAGGNYGIAFILASSSGISGFSASDIYNNASDTPTTGSYGYAVVMGNGGTGGDTDRLRLVKFTNGLSGTSVSAATMTDLVRDEVDHNTEFFNIRVTYDPGTSNWSLYATTDVSAFSDPTAVTTQIGSSVIDTTYTGSALTHMGALWNYANGVGGTAAFDNISVVVQTPEPTAAMSLIGLAGLGLARRSRRSPAQ